MGTNTSELVWRHCSSPQFLLVPIVKFGFSPLVSMQTMFFPIVFVSHHFEIRIQSVSQYVDNVHPHSFSQSPFQNLDLVCRHCSSPQFKFDSIVTFGFNNSWLGADVLYLYTGCLIMQQLKYEPRVQSKMHLYELRQVSKVQLGRDILIFNGQNEYKFFF